MVQKLVHAVYEQDSKGVWELLSERGKSVFAGESEAVPALAPVIKKKWNCPVERVTVLAADFDHPHLKGRVRVPVILDPEGVIPAGYILPEGSPLPSTCEAIPVLLVREKDRWKVDNIKEIARSQRPLPPRNLPPVNNLAYRRL